MSHPTPPDNGTRTIRITLSALTRVEYTEIIQVPADITEEELDALVDQRYDEVDGGAYVDDVDFWKRGNDCGHQPAKSGCEPDLSAVRSPSGDLILVPL